MAAATNRRSSADLFVSAARWKSRRRLAKRRPKYPRAACKIFVAAVVTGCSMRCSAVHLVLRQKYPRKEAWSSMQLFFLKRKRRAIRFARTARATHWTRSSAWCGLDVASRGARVAPLRGAASASASAVTASPCAPWPPVASPRSPCPDAGRLCAARAGSSPRVDAHRAGAARTPGRPSAAVSALDAAGGLQPCQAARWHPPGGPLPLL
eukprot:scaffold1159_cov215-Pinguiococcus_pyrenoidosus.AAC.23